jgi:ABC-type nitrate/sulfonate/bicarbonate transport system substrate-binding protein
MPAALETGSIQGFVASSPVWMTPVFKGTGIVWVDGPKGELPPDVLPLISGVLSTTEDFAKNNPTVIDRVHRTLKSLAGLVATNPEQAKASFAKVYPSLDQRTIDEAFAREAPNFTKMELSAQDIHHEIGILKAQGSTLQNLSDFRPKTILYSR